MIHTKKQMAIVAFVGFDHGVFIFCEVVFGLDLELSFGIEMSVLVVNFRGYIFRRLCWWPIRRPNAVRDNV